MEDTIPYFALKKKKKKVLESPVSLVIYLLLESCLYVGINSLISKRP